MKKIPNKIIAFALILPLILGFSGARQTNAYYNDTESSNDNLFTASSLDFSLDSESDFAPEVDPETDALRSVSILNDGSLGFDYNVKIANPVGDLCPVLDLSASLDGGAGVTEPLNTFDIGPFTFGSPEDWDFTVSLNNDDASYQEETCNFDIVFDGEQIGGAGFSDTETIASLVTAGEWEVDSCVTDPEDTISTVVTGLSFGTNGHNLIVASGGELKSPTSGGSNGVITVSTDCDVTVQSGGKITAVKGDGKGGTMTISARNFTVDVGGIVSASSTASGKDGGTATVTTTGNFAVNGTFSANGHDKGGSIIVDSNDNVSISGSSLTATSANKDGGSIILSADNDITVTGLVSTSAKEEGGTVIILAGGDLTVSAGGSVLAESTNKKGGTIEAIIDEESTVAGTLSVDGEDGDGFIIMTIQGNMTVSGTGLITANSTGSGKDGGTIGIKVGGNTTYSGIVRANATKNAKSVALWSEGSTTINGTVSATGGSTGGDNGGIIDITTRATLSGAGTIDATGDDDGSIIQRTVTNSFAGTATPAAVSESITLSDIVLNEIIPDPVGDDQGNVALPLNGEWMELYNKGGVAVDVNGWILRDADGNILTISASKGDNDNDLSDAGETVVPAGGTLTVYRNGASGAGALTLADDGDTVQLLTDTSILVDSFTYVVDVGTGNSIARMPDGTGAWVDPEPTPTAPNGSIDIDKLKQEFLKRLNAKVVEEEEEIIIESNPEIPETTVVEEVVENVLELLLGSPEEETVEIIVEVTTEGGEIIAPDEEPVLIAPELAETPPMLEEPVSEPAIEELVAEIVVEEAILPEVVTEILEAVETVIETTVVIIPESEPTIVPEPAPEPATP